MKIFFVASLHGKEKYSKNYKTIGDIVSKLGHKLDADHVLQTTKEDIASWDAAKNLEYHKRIIAGIKKCDVVFSEMSYPSTSVGYLLSVAVDAGKPVVLFYSGDEPPHLLPTLENNERFQLIQYNDFSHLEEEVKLALEYAAEQQDTRFNFFISPKIGNYLDWIAKNKRIPRAVYLRKLIESDIEKNPDMME